jgi:hypothetical protein
MSEQNFKALYKLSEELRDSMARNQPELVVQHPWDQLTVQRWQLARLTEGLGEIVKTLDAATPSDRLNAASALGFGAGMALALQMLVETMQRPPAERLSEQVGPAF